MRTSLRAAMSRAPSAGCAQRPSCSRTRRVTSPPSARPLRLAHDVADDDADRLHVAAAQLLGDVGVGRPAPAATIGASSSPPPTAPRPSASTIARGSPPSATSCRAPAARRPGVTCLLADHRRRAWPARPARHVRLRRVGSARCAEQLADPVGERLGLERRCRRAERRLEVVAELGAERQQPRAVGAQAEVALEALGARGGQLGQRRAGALEHLLR